MNTDNENILDYPEEQPAPRPRLYYYLFMVAAGAVIVGSFFKIMHWPYSTFILIWAWLLLITHFVLRLVANLKHHPLVCLRDFGRLAVITGVMLKIMALPFALPSLVAGGVIYGIGYFVAWKS